MTKKDLSEIRRHMSRERTNITKVYGCFFNSERQVISTFERPVVEMSETELDMWLKRLKKPVSGAIGKAVYSVPLDTGSTARGQLMRLYESELADEPQRTALCERIIENMNMDEGAGNYLILLAFDSYDVPTKTSTGDIDRENSDVTYSYLICCVCGVQDGNPVLRFERADREFILQGLPSVVGDPLCGFVYPAFSDRSPDFNSVSYCIRKQDYPHGELVELLFQADTPVTENRRREAFRHALTEAQDGACSFDTFCDLYRAVERAGEIIDTDDSPYIADGMTEKDVCGMLEKCGLSEQQVQTFRREFVPADSGEDPTAVRVRPSAIMETGKLNIVAGCNISSDGENAVGEIKITVPESAMDLFRIKEVDGRRYIMIPADIGVEVNGVAVK